MMAAIYNDNKDHKRYGIQHATALVVKHFLSSAQDVLSKEEISEALYEKILKLYQDKFPIDFIKQKEVMAFLIPKHLQALIIKFINGGYKPKFLLEIREGNIDLFEMAKLGTEVIQTFIDNAELFQSLTLRQWLCLAEDYRQRGTDLFAQMVGAGHIQNFLRKPAVVLYRKLVAVLKSTKYDSKENAEAFYVLNELLGGSFSEDTATSMPTQNEEIFKNVRLFRILMVADTQLLDCLQSTKGKLPDDEISQVLYERLVESDPYKVLDMFSEKSMLAFLKPKHIVLLIDHFRAFRNNANFNNQMKNKIDIFFLAKQDIAIVVRLLSSEELSKMLSPYQWIEIAEYYKKERNTDIFAIAEGKISLTNYIKSFLAWPEIVSYRNLFKEHKRLQETQLPEQLQSVVGTLLFDSETGIVNHIINYAGKCFISLSEVQYYLEAAINLSPDNFYAFLDRLYCQLKDNKSGLDLLKELKRLNDVCHNTAVQQIERGRYASPGDIIKEKSAVQVFVGREFLGDMLVFTYQSLASRQFTSDLQQRLTAQERKMLEEETLLVQAREDALQPHVKLLVMSKLQALPVLERIKEKSRHTIQQTQPDPGWRKLQDPNPGKCFVGENGNLEDGLGQIYHSPSIATSDARHCIQRLRGDLRNRRILAQTPSQKTSACQTVNDAFKDSAIKLEVFYNEGRNCFAFYQFVPVYVFSTASRFLIAQNAALACDFESFHRLRTSLFQTQLEAFHQQEKELKNDREYFESNIAAQKSKIDKIKSLIGYLSGNLTTTVQEVLLLMLPYYSAYRQVGSTGKSLSKAQQMYCDYYKHVQQMVLECKSKNTTVSTLNVVLADFTKTHEQAQTLMTQCLREELERANTYLMEMQENLNKQSSSTYYLLDKKHKEIWDFLRLAVPGLENNVENQKEIDILRCCLFLFKTPDDTIRKSRKVFEKSPEPDNATIDDVVRKLPTFRDNIVKLLSNFSDAQIPEHLKEIVKDILARPEPTVRCIVGIQRRLSDIEWALDDIPSYTDFVKINQHADWLTVSYYPYYVRLSIIVNFLNQVEPEIISKDKLSECWSMIADGVMDTPYQSIIEANVNGNPFTRFILAAKPPVTVSESDPSPVIFSNLAPALNQEVTKGSNLDMRY